MRRGARTIPGKRRGRISNRLSRESNPLPILPEPTQLYAKDESEETRETVILELLRKIALSRQGSKGRAFYSIRNVAQHFKISPTKVTRLYSRLHDEGIIGAIWGSKTIIEPIELDVELRLKAVVGLPVSLRWFSVARGYRVLLSLLQEQLWSHGLCPRLAFYRDTLEQILAAIEKLCAYRVNLVIWLVPSSEARKFSARFHDRDVPCIMLHDRPPKERDSGYFINRDKALAEALRNWRREGVSVLVVSGPVDEVGLSEDIVRQAAQEARLDLVPLTATTKSSAGAIVTSPFARLEFEQTLAAHPGSISRALHFRGMPDWQRAARGNLRSDSIEWDSKKIARKIAADIAERLASRLRQQMVFKGFLHTGAMEPGLSPLTTGLSPTPPDPPAVVRPGVQ